MAWYIHRLFAALVAASAVAAAMQGTSAGMIAALFAGFASLLWFAYSTAVRDDEPHCAVHEVGY